MLKLMKYEFRKQLFSKFCILGLIILAELNFLIRVILEDSANGRAASQGIGLAVGILVLLTYGALIFVAFESIFVFNKDLKSKQSYMLFLVPKSTYAIVGAKVIMALLQIVLVGAAFIALAIVDYFIIGLKFGGFTEAVKMLTSILETMLDIRANATELILAFSYLAFLWFICIIVGMLSVTLSTTFLANSKFKVIISVVLFILLIYAIFKLFGVIAPSMLTTDSKGMGHVVSYLYLLGVSSLGYFLTAWMLDKKVSV